LKHEQTKAVRPCQTSIREETLADLFKIGLQIYWPIWRFTCLADIDVAGSSKSPSLIMFNSTGLSGNSFSPISLLDFTEPELPDDLLPWDAEQDLKQLESVGMKVDAVPFSVDPLKVVEDVKRKVGRHVRLGDLKVDLERDVNEIMVSSASREPCEIFPADFLNAVLHAFSSQHTPSISLFTYQSGLSN